MSSASSAATLITPAERSLLQAASVAPTTPPLLLAPRGDRDAFLGDSHAGGSDDEEEKKEPRPMTHFVAQFGGQGPAGEEYLEELYDVFPGPHHRYRPFQKGGEFVRELAVAILEELDCLPTPVLALFSARGVGFFKNCFKDPEASQPAKDAAAAAEEAISSTFISMPPATFLAATPVSCPMLFVSQMANFVDSSQYFAGGLRTVLSSLHSAIGHSQGLSAALVLGAAEGDETTFILSREFTKLLLILGIYTHLESHPSSESLDDTPDQSIDDALYLTASGGIFAGNALESDGEKVVPQLDVEIDDNPDMDASPLFIQELLEAVDTLMNEYDTHRNSTAQGGVHAKQGDPHALLSKRDSEMDGKSASGESLLDVVAAAKQNLLAASISAGGSQSVVGAGGADQPQQPPGNQFEITFYTGTKKGSGTTSQVYCQFVGYRGDSEILQMEKRAAGFQDGTVDSFTHSCNNETGDIKELRVWTDGTGESRKVGLFRRTVESKWRCDKVIVTHKATCRQWLFNFEVSIYGKGSPSNCEAAKSMLITRGAMGPLQLPSSEDESLSLLAKIPALKSEPHAGIAKEANDDGDMMMAQSDASSLFSAEHLSQQLHRDVTFFSSSMKTMMMAVIKMDSEVLERFMYLATQKLPSQNVPCITICNGPVAHVLSGSSYGLYWMKTVIDNDALRERVLARAGITKQPRKDSPRVIPLPITVPFHSPKHLRRVSTFVKMYQERRAGHECQESRATSFTLFSSNALRVSVLSPADGTDFRNLHLRKGVKVELDAIRNSIPNLFVKAQTEDPVHWPKTVYTAVNQAHRITTF